MNTKTYKQTQETVKQILARYPATRDSDFQLCAEFWAKELKEIKRNVDFFLLTYAAGHLTNSDSITRARRKLQEENPSLRGEKYYERHKRQKEVQLELGYNVK